MLLYVDIFAVFERQKPGDHGPETDRECVETCSTHHFSHLNFSFLKFAKFIKPKHCSSPFRPCVHPPPPIPPSLSFPFYSLIPSCPFPLSNYNRTQKTRLSIRQPTVTLSTLSLLSLSVRLGCQGAPGAPAHSTLQCLNTSPTITPCLSVHPVFLSTLSPWTTLLHFHLCVFSFVKSQWCQ